MDQIKATRWPEKPRHDEGSEFRWPEAKSREQIHIRFVGRAENYRQELGVQTVFPALAPPVATPVEPPT